MLTLQVQGLADQIVDPLCSHDQKRKERVPLQTIMRVLEV